jgi:hypothetical protein
MFVDIFAEFNGRTPRIILDLFKDFHDQEYLTKDSPKGIIPDIDIINDSEFIKSLTPIPFKIIEIG